MLIVEACHRRAAPYEFRYNSASSGSSYILNTNPLNQSEAELFCRDNGMHLVTWESAAEQSEVSALTLPHAGPCLPPAACA